MKRIVRFEGKIVSVRQEEMKKDFDRDGTPRIKYYPGKRIDFYLEKSNRRIYLFTQKYTAGVHEVFRMGLRDYQIRGYKKWNRNPRLDKTIDKIPLYLAYYMKEMSEDVSSDYEKAYARKCCVNGR